MRLRSEINTAIWKWVHDSYSRSRLFDEIEQIFNEYERLAKVNQNPIGEDTQDGL